jgi:hypothetical protein
MAASLWRKLKVKFLLASLKAFTTFENPLQKACSGSQVGTYYVHWRKWINDRDAKPKLKQGSLKMLTHLRMHRK